MGGRISRCLLREIFTRLSDFGWFQRRHSTAGPDTAAAEEGNDAGAAKNGEHHGWLDPTLLHDEKDGQFGVSNWLASRHGFMPVPVIITGPTLAIGRPNLNLDFYPEILGKELTVDVNLIDWSFYQEAKWRLGKSDFFFGADYIYAERDASPAEQAMPQVVGKHYENTEHWYRDEWARHKLHKNEMARKKGLQ